MRFKLGDNHEVICFTLELSIALAYSAACFVTKTHNDDTYQA